MTVKNYVPNEKFFYYKYDRLLFRKWKMYFEPKDKFPKRVKQKMESFFHCVKAERAEQALAVIKRPKVPRFNLDP